VLNYDIVRPAQIFLGDPSSFHMLSMHAHIPKPTTLSLKRTTLLFLVTGLKCFYNRICTSDSSIPYAHTDLFINPCTFYDHCMQPSFNLINKSVRISAKKLLLCWKARQKLMLDKVQITWNFHIFIGFTPVSSCRFSLKRASWLYVSEYINNVLMSRFWQSVYMDT